MKDYMFGGMGIWWSGDRVETFVGEKSGRLDPGGLETSVDGHGGVVEGRLHASMEVPSWQLDQSTFGAPSTSTDINWDMFYDLLVGLKPQSISIPFTTMNRRSPIPISIHALPHTKVLNSLSPKLWQGSFRNKMLHYPFRIVAKSYMFTVPS